MMIGLIIFVSCTDAKRSRVLGRVNSYVDSIGCVSCKLKLSEWGNFISMEPVQPGGEVALEVAYKADHPEHLDKTVTVHCNAEASPLVLRINGNAG